MSEYENHLEENRIFLVFYFKNKVQLAHKYVVVRLRRDYAKNVEFRRRNLSVALLP